MAQEGLAVQDYESWQSMNQIPAKRKAPGSDTEPVVHSKKKKLSGSLQTKNAVQALNEYKPGNTVGALVVLFVPRNSCQVWTMLSSVRVGPVTPLTSRLASLCRELSL